MSNTCTNWMRTIGLVGFGIAVGIAVPGRQRSNAREAAKIEPARIGYVNVAKVLREFDRANRIGAKITARRAECVALVKDERGKLAKRNKEFEETKDAGEKELIRLRAVESQKKIESIDASAQKELTELSNKTIIEVHDQIRGVVKALAEDHGLDIVQAFPAASNAKEEQSVQVAQLMLQTPALIPYYMKPGFDVTDEVIERLNKKFPADPEDGPAKCRD